jgi:hypothetical protein
MQQFTLNIIYFCFQMYSSKGKTSKPNSKYGKPTTSPGATKYFNHYPSNFLKPYGMADDPPSAEKIAKRIHPISCEWLKRPAVAMSEFAETVTENINWLTEEDGKSSIAALSNLATLHEKMEPMLKALKRLNTKSDEDAAKKKHVRKVLNHFYDDANADVHEAMANMVKLGGAMFVTGIQYMVVNQLVTEPQMYANKMVGDDEFAQKFKSNPCVGGLVEMLNETCVPDSFGQSRSTSSSGSKRNLLEQLEKVTPKKKPRKQSRVVVETPDEDTD